MAGDYAGILRSFLKKQETEESHVFENSAKLHMVSR